MATLKKDAVVIFKAANIFLSAPCGIVRGPVKDEGNYVWVRWNGEQHDKKEFAPDLNAV